MADLAQSPDPALAADLPLPEPKPALDRGESLLRRHVSTFFQSPGAVLGLLVLTILVGLALFAPYVAPQNPYDLSQLDIMDNMLQPGEELSGGMKAWLGTDDQGRDMLSAILYGLRISLMVGAVSVLIGSVIGASVGVLAAYAGGRVESVIMRIVDLQLSFPAILVALILLAVFGRGVDKVIMALVIVQWAYYARTVRGSALVETGANTSRPPAASRCRARASCSSTCCRTACLRSSSWPRCISRTRSPSNPPSPFSASACR
jgi:peptide/nickel transport system permease protein